MDPKNPSGTVTGGNRTPESPAPGGAAYDSGEPQDYDADGDSKSVDKSAVDEPLQDSTTSESFTGSTTSLSGATASEPDIITHTIIFWQNGFTVDYGPLRRLDDPQNAPFLQRIKKFECPEELEPPDRRTRVHVDLIRRPENYPDPFNKSHIPIHGVEKSVDNSSFSDLLDQMKVQIKRLSHFCDYLSMVKANNGSRR